MLNVTSGSRAITLAPARSEPRRILLATAPRPVEDAPPALARASSRAACCCLRDPVGPLRPDHRPARPERDQHDARRCRARAAITCSAPINSAATISAGCSTAAARR